jgi:hypothetical protein
MSIEPTEQQQQALDALGEALPRTRDPRTKVAYVLVPGDEYEATREIFEDERRQSAIRATAA